MSGFDIIDLIKIGITVASIVSLYLFRKQIIKVVSDIVVGGDTSKYQDSSVSQLANEISNQMQEILK